MPRRGRLLLSLCVWTFSRRRPLPSRRCPVNRDLDLAPVSPSAVGERWAVDGTRGVSRVPCLGPRRVQRWGGPDGSGEPLWPPSLPPTVVRSLLRWRSLAGRDPEAQGRSGSGRGRLCGRSGSGRARLWRSGTGRGRLCGRKRAESERVHLDTPEILVAADPTSLILT